MADLVSAVYPTIRMIVGSAFIISVLAIAAGVYFIYLNSSGIAEVNIFGTSLRSNNAGVTCVFVGAITLLFTLRSALKTVNRTVDGESKQYIAPVDKSDIDDDELALLASNRKIEFIKSRRAKGKPSRN